MKINISENSTVAAIKEQVSSEMDGDIIIFNMKNGIYYGLDSVGTKIWNLIQEPKTVREIHDAILNEYDVEPERCMNDLVSLLNRLSEERLIEVKD